MVKIELGWERVKLRAPGPTSWLRLILKDKDKQQNDQQKSDDTTTDVHVASPFNQFRHHPPNVAGCLAGAARFGGQRAALKQEDEQHDHQDERDCPDADVHAAHLLQSSDSLSVLSGEGAVTRHQRVPGHYHATTVPPGMTGPPQGLTA